MRLVYFGSGAFGLPTLEALLANHQILLVVTQPDRPAGRGRELAATPVGQRLAAAGVPVLKPDKVNLPEIREQIRAVAADAFVVIAFGQKLGRELLADRFAINLHGSLLPRHRGAAPVNAAILSGDERTGVSVITLAERMDAGEILAERSTAIGATETAGELHDRLALLGPEAVLAVLAAESEGRTSRRAQDEALATRAPKLSRADGVVSFDRSAREIRCRINGLSPWPGVELRVGGIDLKVRRAGECPLESGESAVPIGTLLGRGRVRCADGAVELLEVQPRGGRVMPFADFARGRDLVSGARVESASPTGPAPRTSGRSGVERFRSGSRGRANPIEVLLRLFARGPSASAAAERTKQKRVTRESSVASSLSAVSAVPGVTGGSAASGAASSSTMTRRARRGETPRGTSRSALPLPPRVEAPFLSGRPLREPYAAIVESMLESHRIRVRGWRKSMSGMAWLSPGPDGALTRWIEVPEPRSPMSCSIFLHEVGHHAIGIGRFRPRSLEEFHAWRWSLQSMRDCGIPVTAAVERRVHDSLRYAVAKAVRRGARTIPAELAPFAAAGVVLER